jgi:hypothetical protein
VQNCNQGIEGYRDIGQTVSLWGGYMTLCRPGPRNVCGASCCIALNGIELMIPFIPYRAPLCPCCFAPCLAQYTHTEAATDKPLGIMPSLPQ